MYNIKNIHSSGKDISSDVIIGKKHKSMDFNQNQLKKGRFIPMSKKNNMLDTYIFGKMLGKGGFSSVYAVKHKQLGEERVVKIIKKDAQNMTVDFEKELSILKELDHPNIIKLYEVFETKDFIQIIQEYDPLIADVVTGVNCLMR